MQSLNLKDSDAALVRSALEIARDQYRKDAEVCRAEPGHDRMAEQFEKQAADAERLIEQIDA